MAPTRHVLPGHGLVFLFTPVTGIRNTNAAQNLGLFSRAVDGNSSNHVFGVEFDVFANEEFGDINDNHVGIDVNSLTSVNSTEAGYFRDQDEGFRRLQLNNGRINSASELELLNFVNLFLVFLIKPIAECS
ncbi:hypothetical protein LXL04_009625 [Taraxacum kok-saghyz]